MRRIAGLVGVLLVVATLLAAAPAGAATWSAPVTISVPGKENTEADLAIADNGTAIVVWQGADCNQNDPQDHRCENGRIQYSVRPLGGTFSPPVEIPGDPGTEAAVPEVAVDAAGNALVAWMSFSAGSFRVRYSLRPAGGDFEAAKTIADGGAVSSFIPDLAMAPDGRAVVTFQRRVAGLTEASYAIRQPGDEFGPAASMAGDPGVTNQNTAPKVRLDETGAGIAYWRNSPVGGTRIRFAQLAAGAEEFAPTETLAAGNDESLAMAPSGAAVFAWTPPGTPNEILYAFRAPGAAFGTPLSIPEPDSPQPIAAIDPAGRAVIAWSAEVPPSSVFPRWAASPFGGPFGAPNPMPPGTQGLLNDLDVSDQGTALALWVDTSEPIRQVRASVRPPEGVFGDSAVLPSPPQGAAFFGATAAFDASGNGVALWNGADPGTPGSHDVPLLASALDPNRTGPEEKATTPRINGLRVRPKRFLVGGRPTAKVSARGKMGTTVRFGLSERATIRLAVERRKPGVRVKVKGKLRCLPATPANLERGTGKRCPLFKRAGTLVRNNLPSGPTQIKFSGRIGRKTLAPGRYRLVTTAVNQAGNSSQPQRTGFQILSP